MSDNHNEAPSNSGEASQIDLDKRNFLIATSAVGAIGAAAVAIPFVKSMTPSERAKAAGVKYEGVCVMGDVPYEYIIDTAKKKKCDLIMMASHGRRGISALLLGSETSKVLTHSKTPVLVVR